MLALAVTEWSNIGLDEWQIAPHDFHRVLMLEDVEVLVATSGFTAVALALAAGTLNEDVADIAFYVGEPWRAGIANDA